MMVFRKLLLLWSALFGLWFLAPAAYAQPLPIAVQRIESVRPEPGALDSPRTSEVVRIALILTLMVLIPATLICMTSFVRIIVVLSMIRHAFGMPETPPNQVLVSLALFLTAFSMMPTFSAVNDHALQPFLDGRLSVALTQ